MPDIDLEENKRWRDQALCAQTDPEAFFPERENNNSDAKRMCAQCGVQNECLAYALRNDERFGIWGGKSTKERKRIKNDMPAKPLARAQIQRRERDRVIVAMAGRGADVPFIAAEFRITDKTVYRVLDRHRAQKQEQCETTP